MFDLLLEWYAEDGFRGCGIVSAAAELRVSDPAVTEVARRHLQVYRDFFLSHLSEAGVEKPEQLTERLLILLEGATTVASIDGTSEAGKQARALTADLIEASDQIAEQVDS